MEKRKRQSVWVSEWETEGFGMGLGLPIQAERQRMRRYLVPRCLGNKKKYLGTKVR